MYGILPGAVMRNSDVTAFCMTLPARALTKFANPSPLDRMDDTSKFNSGPLIKIFAETSRACCFMLKSFFVKNTISVHP